MYAYSYNISNNKNQKVKILKIWKKTSINISFLGYLGNKLLDLVEINMVYLILILIFIYYYLEHILFLNINFEKLLYNYYSTFFLLY